MSGLPLQLALQECCCIPYAISIAIAIAPANHRYPALKFKSFKYATQNLNTLNRLSIILTHVRSMRTPEQGRVRPRSYEDTERLDSCNHGSTSTVNVEIVVNACNPYNLLNLATQ